MSRFITDFSEYTTGQAPSDWSTPSWSPATFSTAQVIDGTAVGGTGNVLELSGPVGRKYFLWDAITASDSVEVLARVRAVGATTDFGIALQTQAGAETGYVGRYNASTDVENINEIISGTVSNIGTVAKTIDSSVWRWVRFRRYTLNGRINIKSWTGNVSDEPLAWDHSNVDQIDITAAGIAGIFHLGAGAGETLYIDFFSVGTENDHASTFIADSPMPLCQFLMNEASSGTGPTTLADNTGHGNTLNITYNGDAVWTSIAAGNGMDFTAAPGTSSSAGCLLSDIVNNGNLGAELDGSKTFWFAMVLRNIAGSSLGSRLFAIGTNTGNTDISIVKEATNIWRIRFDQESGGGNYTMSFFHEMPLDTAQTLVIQIDTNEDSIYGRTRIWIDEVEIELFDSNLAQNASLGRINQTDRILSLANRGSLNRNVQGQIYYAEMGKGILTSASRKLLFDNLAADNDAAWEPPGGPTGYYLQWSGNAGSSLSNKELLEITGIVGTLASVEYTVKNTALAFESVARYVFDARRQEASPTSGGDIGYILQTSTGVYDTSGITNLVKNGAPATAADFFTAYVPDDVFSFTVNFAPSDGTFSFGARFQETEHNYGFAVSEIIVTDDNGAHVINMSDSGGTGTVVLSTDSVLTARLYNFPVDDSQWVSYALPTILSGTAEQSSQTNSNLSVATPLAASSSQASEAESVLATENTLALFGEATQASDSDASILIAIGLSGSSDQASQAEGTTQLGVSLAATTYTDSATVGGLTVALPLIGTSTQGHDAIATLVVGTSLSGASETTGQTESSLTVGIPLSGLAEQTSEGVAGLAGVGWTGISNQASETEAKLSVAVGFSGTSEQESESTASLIVGIPLSAASETPSESLGSLTLAKEIPLTGLSTQDSGATGFLNIDNGRLLGVIEQGSEAEGILSIAISLKGNSSQENLVNPARLSTSIALRGISSQNSAVGPSVLNSNPRLLFEPVETQSKITGSLTVPALNSTGWLTASDIFLHNAYWESIEVSRIQASDVRLEPALKVDSISIKPE